MSAPVTPTADAADEPAFPRRRRKGEEMRRRFIEVTTRLVREHGVGAVSTRTICDAVGVKAPTLYHHFGDIANLHTAVIDNAFENYYTFWKDRSKVDDPFQRLRDGWDAYISFSQAEPELYAIVAQQNFANDLPSPIVKAHDDLIEDFRMIHAIRPLRYKPELAAQILTASCLGVASMLAAQQHGIPTGENLSAIAREAVIGSLLL